MWSGNNKSAVSMATRVLALCLLLLSGLLYLEFEFGLLVWQFLSARGDNFWRFAKGISSSSYISTDSSSFLMSDVSIKRLKSKF